MTSNVLEYFAFSDGQHPRLVRKERPVDDLGELLAEIEASMALPLVFTHAAATPARSRVHVWHTVFDWLAAPARTLTLPRLGSPQESGLYEISPPRFYDLSLTTTEWHRVRDAAVVDSSAVFLAMHQLEQMRDQHHTLIEQLAKQLSAQVRAAEAAETLIWSGIAATIEAIDTEAADADAAALQRTMQRRDWLISNESWLSSTEIAEQARGALVESNKDQYAYHLRQSGQILGVRHKRIRLHPKCQFRVIDGRLEPLSVMKPLLELLPKDESGWEQTLWLFQRTGRLDSKRPADMLAVNPEDVLIAAKKDFHGDEGI